MKPYEIKQFRRQNRANINNQRERTYKYDNKIVAKNRRARFEQKGNSLEDWFEEQVALYGKQEAEKMRSKLTVTKSTRYYNDKNRIMPGATFLHKNKRYVLSGQLSNGTYYRAVGCGNQNFPAKECIILTKNTGLVYL